VPLVLNERLVLDEVRRGAGGSLLLPRVDEFRFLRDLRTRLSDDESETASSLANGERAMLSCSCTDDGRFLRSGTSCGSDFCRDGGAFLRFIMLVELERES